MDVALEKRKEVWRKSFEFDFTPESKKITVSLDAQQNLRLVVPKPRDYIKARQKLKERAGGDANQRMKDGKYDFVGGGSRRKDSKEKSRDSWFATAYTAEPPEEIIDWEDYW